MDSFERKWWKIWSVVFLTGTTFGSLWIGQRVGRSQGRAEQEAFDHANAPKVDESVVYGEAYKRGYSQGISDEYKMAKEIYGESFDRKPHKAAPKVPAVIDVEPGAPFTVGNGWTFTCITADLEKRTVTGTCPKDPPAGLQGPPMFSLPQCTRDTSGVCTSPVAQLE